MTSYACYYIFILSMLGLCVFTGGGLKRPAQDNVYFPLIFLVTLLFAGLRAEDIDRDYGNYYNYYNSFFGDSSNLLTVDRDPGFGLLYLFFSKLGLTFHVVVFATTAMSLAAMFYFSWIAAGNRKYAPLLVYLVLCKCFALHLMTQDRVGIAIPLMSIGIFLVCEKKYAYGLALYALAAVFHVSILLSLPLLLLLLFNKKLESRLWLVSLVPVALIFIASQPLQDAIRLSLVNMSRTSVYLDSSDNASFTSGYTLLQMAVLAYVLFMWKRLAYFDRAAAYGSGLGLLFKYIFASTPTIAYRSAELFCILDMYVFIIPVMRLKALARVYYSCAVTGILGFMYFASLDILEPYKSIF